MRHAIIMTCYKDIDSIRDFILCTPLDFDIYIHVDKKSKLNFRSFENFKNCFIFSKYRVFWGSINHVYAIIFLLSQAIKNNYDYYHIISGEDFYASPPEDFDKIVKQGYNYIGLFKLPYKPWRVWGGGYDIFTLRTCAKYIDVRFGIGLHINNLMKSIQNNLPILKKKIPTNLALYGSSVYCSLCNESVKWLLNDPLSLHLLKFLNNTTCGEEVYFATALMNSPYSKQCISNHLRYINWNRRNLVLEIDDYDNIVNAGPFLFCRKSQKDSPIRQKIYSVLYQTSTKNESSSNFK